MDSEAYSEAYDFATTAGRMNEAYADQFAERYAKYVARVQAGDSADRTPVSPRSYWYRTGA